MCHLMIAAPHSGSGKTVLTMGLLEILKRKGMNPCAFKCGPDYIDPMFHRSVLGVESHNLDLFFADEDRIRTIFRRYAHGHGAAVIEGVMGFYDGVGGCTSEASAYHLAAALDVPVLLCVRPQGSSLTMAAEIRGLAQFRSPSHIAGIVFNDCRHSFYQTMASSIERETGIPVLGYIPPMREAAIDSRHLGLYTPAEIHDLQARIRRLADTMEETVDIRRLLEIGKNRSSEEDHRIKDGSDDAKPTVYLMQKKGISHANHSGMDAESAVQNEEIPKEVHIAVARDAAFCFCYAESIDALKDAGANPVFFSPMREEKLPENVDGLYLPGGYPELYLKELCGNEAMRTQIRNAVTGGLPTIAECGGFLYLGESIEENGCGYPMCQVLPMKAKKKDHAVRFGYEILETDQKSMLFRPGESYPAHEFHHWDSSAPGEDLQAVKPVRGRSWRLGYVSDTLYAGFAHLYMAGQPILAKRFTDACRSYKNHTECGCVR